MTIGNMYEILQRNLEYAKHKMTYCMPDSWHIKEAELWLLLKNKSHFEITYSAQYDTHYAPDTVLKTLNI